MTVKCWLLLLLTKPKCYWNSTEEIIYIAYKYIHIPYIYIYVTLLDHIMQMYDKYLHSSNSNSNKGSFIFLT